MPAPTTSDLKRDARAFIRRVYNEPSPTTADGLADLFVRSPWEPSSHKEKRELLASALAFAIIFEGDTDLLKRLRGDEIVHDKTAARLFVQRLSPSPLTDSDRRSKRWSAWTLAVLHLLRRNVKPSEVEGLALSGETITQWSRGAVAPPSVTTSPAVRIQGALTLKIGSKKTKWQVTDGAELTRAIAKLIKRGLLKDQQLGS